MKTLLLIDGNALIHRAYYALPDFKTKSGLHTNAVYGFFAMLHKAIIDFKPTHVVICFDTPKPTFRRELLATYQAQRPEAPDEFKMQFPMIREAVDAAGITRLEKDGFEADDIIGTIATHYKTKDFKVIILTGDRDIMQLVDKNVYVVTPQKGVSDISVYDDEAVTKKMGVPPTKIADFKALAGDPSDNYPGAPGIGPKTAAKLVLEFGSVEDLYKNLENVKEERVRNILKNHKKDVIMSKKIATIVCDVPVKNEIEKHEFKGFNENLKEVFDKFEIRSLKERIFKEQAREQKHQEEMNKKQEVKKEKSPSDQIDLFS